MDETGAPPARFADGVRPPMTCRWARLARFQGRRGAVAPAPDSPRGCRGARLYWRPVVEALLIVINLPRAARIRAVGIALLATLFLGPVAGIARAQPGALLSAANAPLRAEPLRRPGPFLLLPPLFSRADAPLAYGFRDAPAAAEQVRGRAVCVPRAAELRPE